jgi:hypothetical protein
MEQRSVTVGIGPVSFDEVAAVARQDAKIVIADEAWAAVSSRTMAYRQVLGPWRLVTFLSSFGRSCNAA